MAKAMVAVEIPDGWELACPEMREPLALEWALNVHGEPYQVFATDTSYGMKRVIVRRAWEWPAWLKAEWLFCGPSGVWYASNERPNGRVDGPEGCQGWWLRGTTMLIGDLIGFDPPPCDDWRESLRRNPAFNDDQAF